MIRRLRFQACYLLFWLVFFILLKALFLIYHAGAAGRLPLKLLAGVFLHGFRMDFSATAWLAAIPFLLIIFSALAPWRFIPVVIRFYTHIAIALSTLIAVADLEIFRAWGFRMDSSVLPYLATPKEAAASAGSSPVLLLLTLLVAIAVAAGYAYERLVQRSLVSLSRVKPLAAIPFLLLAGLLVIPIRGGLGLAPLNQGDAYFCQNDFANQSTLNAVWNFSYSALNKSDVKTNPFPFFDPQTAKQLITPLYNTPPDPDMPLVLTTERPNIVLILWESLTAKVVESLDGRPGITPEFHALENEGLLFTRCYSSGSRSGDGIVSVLSGYPAQPGGGHIIKNPRKTSKLPAITHELKKAGYASLFCYGGDLSFDSMRSYLNNAGFDHIIGDTEFPRADLTSKWGAYDHVVAKRFAKELDTLRSPWFAVLYTTSSHEPFTVPVPTVIQGTDEDSRFLNSVHYADQVIGNLIRTLKKTPGYQNTLIIIIADHGVIRPGNTPTYDPLKYHIPMLWLGGAVSARDSLSTKICSQTDLAATLLGQLRLDAGKYRWSKDILNPRTPSFAEYVFKDGLGYMTEKGCLVFNTTSKALIRMDSTMTDEDMKIGKAYLEMSFQDMMDK